MFLIVAPSPGAVPPGGPRPRYDLPEPIVVQRVPDEDRAEHDERPERVIVWSTSRSATAFQSRTTRNIVPAAAAEMPATSV
jgi:hypothetical protein